MEESLPNEQAGFRKNRCTEDQVTNLTNFIEQGFEDKLTTGALFVDLTAAYDTIWHKGLEIKLLQTIKCTKTTRMIMELIRNRTFVLSLGDKSSKRRKLRNGLPQGSVLAPVLFNIYTADLPNTESQKFTYADDISLAIQANSHEQVSDTLTKDLKELAEYFKKWHLKLSEQKTVTSAIHLNNKLAHKKLDVKLGDRTLAHDDNPTYLGVTLDRSLTYRQHLAKAKKKVNSRVCLLRKVAGTRWGANAHTLRTTAIATVYAPAEYCSSVWAASANTDLVDTQLNSAMRVVSGTLKSTPTNLLPVLSGIAPPDLRRQANTAKSVWRAATDPSTILHEAVNTAVTTRLKSREPYRRRSREFVTGDPPVNKANRKRQADKMVLERWKERWTRIDHKMKEVRSPNLHLPPGANLSRKNWCRLNRLLTGHGRTAHHLHRWKMSPNPACDCGAPDQTTAHIIEACPTRKYSGGYSALAECGEGVEKWLECLDVDL